jgi:arsenite-transporting ATPase
MAFLLQCSNLLSLAEQKPVFGVPQQDGEPIGAIALDHLMTQVFEIGKPSILYEVAPVPIPEKVLPGLSDFIAAGRRLLIVGGKGGVGKTTVAAAIAWGMAEKYGDRAIRVVSIDPAHSLGDAFGQPLGHEPTPIRPNLTGQEVDAEAVLDQFRSEYLWEMAEMMSGETSDGEVTLKIAYGPEAWRKIVAQALPGIDEMLSLITVMDLLESGTQDLIVLDTAPTGHLLRFLEMPAAMSDWLAWIFKLWIKYQDVLGRTDFMGRLRTLRQRVVQAQKKLKDPHHTEFIGVVLAEAAVIAEAQRLSDALSQMGIAQRYIVHNRFEPKVDQQQIISNFLTQTMVHLPSLPRSVTSGERIAIAASLLF